jgi:DNA-binding beta-propeller fold protein YncE
MRFSSSLISAMTAAAAIAALAACSGTNTTPGAGAGAALPTVGDATAFAKPGSPTAIAYISDSIMNSVTAYSSNGKIKLRILRNLKTPGGLLVDKNHDLWVANGGDSNVLVFAPGKTKPKLTLTADGLAPTDVAICPDGTVFVAIDQGPIEVYAHGSTKPTRAMTYQGGAIGSVTCDAAGNVFATGVVNFRSAIVEFPNAKPKGASQLPITTLETPFGIRVAADGKHLLISDQSQYTITEFNENGKPTGKKINTTNGASCITFGVATDGTIGCPVYFENPEGTTVGATFSFPGGTAGPTYTNPLFGQPYGFAFDSST